MHIYSYYLSYYRKFVVGWGWGKGVGNTRVSALTVFLSRQVWLLWIPASLVRFRPLFFIVFCGFVHFNCFTCRFCVFSSPPMSPNGPKSSQNMVGSFKIEVLRTFCFFIFKIVLGFLWEPSGPWFGDPRRLRDSFGRPLVQNVIQNCQKQCSVIAWISPKPPQKQPELPKSTKSVKM